MPTGAFDGDLGHEHAIELVDGGPAAPDGSVAAATDPRSRRAAGGLVAEPLAGAADHMRYSAAGGRLRSHEAATGFVSPSACRWRSP